MKYVMAGSSRRAGILIVGGGGHSHAFGLLLLLLSYSYSFSFSLSCFFLTGRNLHHRAATITTLTALCMTKAVATSVVTRLIPPPAVHGGTDDPA